MNHASLITDEPPVHGRFVNSDSDSGRPAPSLDATAWEHLESSEDLSNYPLDDDNSYQRHVHNGSHPERRRIVRALVKDRIMNPWPIDSDERDPRSRLIDKIADCCKHPVLFASAETSRIFIHQARCKSRVCPRCGKIRVIQLREKILEEVKQLDDPRFMTFTMKSSNDPLENQIKNLIASFRRLRQIKRWKMKCDRGWYFIEITFNVRKQLWHPHIHVVVDGNFYKQKQLSQDWQIASRGSSIVDIRRIAKRSQIARYVTEYVSKSQNPREVKPRQYVEWMMAIRSLRMVQSFGSRGSRKLDSDQSTKVGPATKVVDIMALDHHARRGDKRCERLLMVMGRLLVQKWDGMGPEVIERLSWRHGRLVQKIANWSSDYWRRYDNRQLELSLRKRKRKPIVKPIDDPWLWTLPPP